ncbi:hypothetical protein IMZ48_25150 [Candidatus Bathyarchaeota archaeon]|nr:hypothetical protein [Candidatus Bathyarchaeota archaeon]
MDLTAVVLCGDLGLLQCSPEVVVPFPQVFNDFLAVLAFEAVLDTAPFPLGFLG